MTSMTIFLFFFGNYAHVDITLETAIQPTQPHRVPFEITTHAKGYYGAHV